MALTGRILRTGDQRDYVIAEFDGTNRSGIIPLDDKVLVRMDVHAEVTRGGLRLPDDMRERQTMASETGVIVALGEAAFELTDEGRRWTTRKPAPGDRVILERYAGKVVQGEDGAEYRLCSQKAVGALYERAE